jgi:hypothetical protein
MKKTLLSIIALLGATQASAALEEADAKFQFVSNQTEDTQLLLEHANDFKAQNEMSALDVAYHYSHQSHMSHRSHRSHYSSY